MALSDRQKKAVGFFVTAGLFGIAGGVTLAFQTIPDIVPVLMNAAVVVLASIGIANVVKPDL